MNTYFEFLPLELNVLILAKVNTVDLFFVLEDIYDSDILGKALTIDIFGIRPRYRYNWLTLFDTYYKVKSLGFTLDTLRSPTINVNYDNILNQCTLYGSGQHVGWFDYQRDCILLTKTKQQLTLANSYGVIPSDFLKFLYREGVYEASLLLQVNLLLPLMQAGDFESVNKILLDIFKLSEADLDNLVQEIYTLYDYRKEFDDRLIGYVLSINDVSSVRIRSDILSKMIYIFDASDKVVEEYIQKQDRLTPYNLDIIKVLVNSKLSRIILNSNPSIYFEATDFFRIPISFEDIKNFRESHDLLRILDYIFSGRYPDELSDESNKDYLLNQIYYNLAGKEHYDLDTFKKIVAYANMLI
jgi:hypothetical protein